MHHGPPAACGRGYQVNLRGTHAPGCFSESTTIAVRWAGRNITRTDRDAVGGNHSGSPHPRRAHGNAGFRLPDTSNSLAPSYVQYAASVQSHQGLWKRCPPVPWKENAPLPPVVKLVQSRFWSNPLYGCPQGNMPATSPIPGPFPVSIQCACPSIHNEIIQYPSCSSPGWPGTGGQCSLWAHCTGNLGQLLKQACDVPPCGREPLRISKRHVTVHHGGKPMEPMVVGSHMAVFLHVMCHLRITVLIPFHMSSGVYRSDMVLPLTGFSSPWLPGGNGGMVASPDEHCNPGGTQFNL